MNLKTILIVFLLILEGIFFYITLLYFNLAQTDCWKTELAKYMEKWMLSKFPSYVSTEDAKAFCNHLREYIDFYYYDPNTGLIFYVYKNGTQTTNLTIPFFTSSTSTTTIIK
jgi:hypothetical protein